MRILVTGCAGFIGFHLTKKLLNEGHDVIGIDSLNDYYDPRIKLDRLNKLGLLDSKITINGPNVANSGIDNQKFKFYKTDLEDKTSLLDIFKQENFDSVCNLAAQAGVRYSITNPDIYIKSNIIGFHNILECCRLFKIEGLTFASSSSVYGLSSDLPYSVNKSADHPISLYAATKRSNELLAHSYSHLYSIPVTGLRFFTVYGPWGRPDMAYYKFTDSAYNSKPVELYNDGKSFRDFTYIDDVVEGVVNAILKPSIPNKHWEGSSPLISSSSAPYEIYNIGNDNPIQVSDLLVNIEKITGKKILIKSLGIQPGDVVSTHADIEKSKKKIGYNPTTALGDGLNKFVSWYKEYHEIS